ncbi:hypothetical protein OB919_04410 [Halobacteria archaeon AArc-curdl1]|uniref:DUF8074 domain-containing protein n=1 Tax=Natronosalvus hydrolyticus TaxID=2979988 RepID=A0AAP2Z6V5_9EURY|nr:hypothetical protein [Halobacteria archaeon AArc-curdl1]
MQLTITDLTIFVYNIGVVLSGGYIVFAFDIQDRTLLFVTMLIFAVFWTLYFKFYMVSRLSSQMTSDTEGVET